MREREMRNKGEEEEKEVRGGAGEKRKFDEKATPDNYCAFA